MEDLGNPSGEGAATGGNPVPTGAETQNQPTPGAGTQTPPPDLAAFEQRVAQLERHNEELRRQYNASTQEALRQKERADAQQQQQQELQQRLLLAAGVTSQNPAEPTYRSMAEAQEAWMSGRDPQALDRYEQALEARFQQSADARFTNTVKQAVEPAQWAGHLVEQYSELKDANAPEYKAVLETYAKLANDPLTQRFYPKEAAIAFNGYDLRLVEKAVLTNRASRAEASERQDRPTVLGGDARARQASGGEPTALQLMTPEERTLLQRQLGRNGIPAKESEAAKEFMDLEKEYYPDRFQARIDRARGR